MLSISHSGMGKLETKDITLFQKHQSRSNTALINLRTNPTSLLFYWRPKTISKAEDENPIYKRLGKSEQLRLRGPKSKWRTTKLYQSELDLKYRYRKWKYSPTKQNLNLSQVLQPFIQYHRLMLMLPKLV